MENIKNDIISLNKYIDKYNGECASKAKTEVFLKEWQSFKERYPRLVGLFEGD